MSQSRHTLTLLDNCQLPIANGARESFNERIHNAKKRAQSEGQYLISIDQVCKRRADHDPKQKDSKLVATLEIFHPAAFSAALVCILQAVVSDSSQQ